VRRQIIHDHHVSGLQRWAEHLPDVGVENLGIGSSWDGPASRRTIQSNRAYQGSGIPVALRGFGLDSLSFWSAPTQASQIGLGTGFIQKN
jgi:hypothetical protein